MPTLPARPRPPFGFDLHRFDVRSTLPPALREIMQNGLLDRTFQDALLPEFLYPAVADSRPWRANLGDTQIFTRRGLLAPKTTPITGSDPSPSTYAVEQYQMTMDQYGDSIDTNLLQSAMTLASKFLEDTQVLGIGAGQSLNQIARNRLYRAYAGGRTWVRTPQAAASTTCEVDTVDGFDTVLVNAKPVPVSAANPLPVTVNGVGNTVVAVDPAARRLTLGTAAVQTVGQAVVAGTAPYSIRPVAKETAFNLAAVDRATFSLFRDAVARLRRQNVPGPYVAHVDPDTEAQLFADDEFRQLHQGRADSATFRDLAIGVFGGITWVRNNEAPTRTVGALTVHRPLVIGQGALIAGPFENMGTLLRETAVADIPDVRMIGPAGGVQVALIVRPPLDRLQQILSSTWSWVGDFAVPSDSLTGDNALFKRAVLIEHA